MNAKDINPALTYHEETKHSYTSVRTRVHYLDWDNRPYLFKVYPEQPAIELPDDFEAPQMSAIKAVRKFQAAPDKGSALDIGRLAQVLFFSAGLTKKKDYPGGDEYWFRAAASTGALYEIELYVVCGALPDLQAGVYHFLPRDFKLQQLRKGDYRQELSRAAASDDSLARAPATVMLTAIYWRNAWKYQARCFRHFFWDAGTMTSNLLATCTASQLKSRLVMSFLDGQINRLLGINAEKETGLCLVPLGSNNHRLSNMRTFDIGEIHPKYMPLSAKEVDYPPVREIQAASSFHTAEEVLSWRKVTPPSRSRSKGGQLLPLQPLEESSLPRISLGEVILRRGSTRRFGHKNISIGQLSTILRDSTRGVPADFLGFIPATSLIETYLIINAVDEIPAGAYFFSPEEKALELIKEGNFRSTAGFLCLEQDLGADASAVIFFMADLNTILHLYGNRGYRAVQYEAGIIGGKIYLNAYALALGATGITFYDDDVTRFFSPHAEGKSCIFVMCVGKAGKLNPLGIG